MATPHILYYANVGFGLLNDFDIGSNLTSLDEELELLQSVGESVGGVREQALFRARMRVLLRKERFADSTPTGMPLFRKFWNLQTYLLRGESIALCRDTTKAWAGYTIRG